MGRFVFKLQPVLDQRLRAERVHQRAVAELEGDRFGLESEIRHCHTLAEQERDDLRDRLAAHGAAVDLSGAKLQANASLHLIARAQRAVLKLAAIHNKLDRARLELLAAAAKRKAVELLRDKQFEAWRTDQNRREAAMLDDLTAAAHGRRLGAML